MYGKNFLLGALLLGALAMTGAGCGASDCGSFAEAYCAKLTECQPYFGALLATSTMTDCVSLERGICERSLTAPGSTASEAQAGRCGDVYRKATCDDLYSLTVNAAMDCQTAGTRAVGQPCELGSQCQSGSCLIETGICGTCQATVGAGQACGGANKIGCTAGLSCISSVCVAYGNVGQACSSSAPCQNSLRCVSGTCQPKADPGSACASDSDCKTYLGNQTCDPNAKLCANVTINFVDNGGACSTNVVNNARNICKADFDCVTMTSGGSGTSTCIPRTPVGGTCGNTGNAGCVLGSNCVNHTCQIVDPASCG